MSQENTVMMPTELTAANGGKGLMIGEFKVSRFLECGHCDHGQYQVSEDDYEICDLCNGEGGWNIEVDVDWTTIKAIYAKAVEHFAG